VVDLLLTEVLLLLSEVVAVRLNVWLAHRQSAGLDHLRNVDEMHVRHRARQRRANNRVTNAVWQRHRRNAPRDLRSSGHKPNACRALFDRLLHGPLQRDLRLGRNAPLRGLNSHGRNRNNERSRLRNNSSSNGLWSRNHSKGSKLQLRLHRRKAAASLRNHNKTLIMRIAISSRSQSVKSLRAYSRNLILPSSSHLW
jgi:hypothetical protein